MAFVLADRVRETTTTAGTGAVSLGGAVSGFQSFSTAIGNANNTYYTIADSNTGAWEVGIGTYTSSGNTLSRDTVLSSSNSGNLVNFAANAKDVFVTQPASRAVFVQDAGTGLQTGTTAFTVNRILYANAASTTTTSANLTFDGTTLVAANFTDSSLTSGRVTYATTGGLLTDSANLTFSGSNLGVGLTTSSWAQSKAVEVNTAGNALAGFGDSDTVVTSGVYHNTGWKYAATNSFGASYFEQIYGDHRFYAVAGSAHNAGDAATLTWVATVNTQGLTINTNTANRVAYFNGAKLISDSANLTFDGTTLTANALTVTNNPTLSGGTANGVAYLNGSKVLTTGSALTFDGTTLTNTRNTTDGSAAALTLNNSGATAAYATLNLNAGSVTYQQFADAAGNAIGTAGVMFRTTSNHPLVWGINSTEQMRLTSTGLGIGTSLPNCKFEVKGGSAISTLANSYTNAGMLHQYSSSILLAIGSDGTNPVLQAVNATNDTAKDITLQPLGGNLGLGVTPSAWGSGQRALQTPAGAIWNFNSLNMTITQNAFSDGTEKYINNGFASSYNQNSGRHIWNTAPSGTAGNAISFTQAMTLDASGQLLVGRTSGVYRLDVAHASAGEIARFSYTGGSKSPYIATIAQSDTLMFLDAQNSDNTVALGIRVSGSERARITSGGNLLVGATDSSTSDTVVGCYLFNTGVVQATRTSGASGDFGRLVDDGDIVVFRQAGTVEGSISVSGTTVSYNGGHLARWSQLPDGSKDDDILKGTVMSNLDAMCEWVKDGQPLPNEQLNRMKVSDVEGDTNVAGVFVNWTRDEDCNTDDMNVAMTGDMIIRIAQGVTVQRGNLLMSAGDGTAKPQGDDIVRSKTVAKVTSIHVTCTYADGSYCVPCVLMAC